MCRKPFRPRKDEDDEDEEEEEEEEVVESSRSPPVRQEVNAMQRLRDLRQVHKLAREIEVNLQTYRNGLVFI